MMAALKALVVPILLGVVVVGCSSPRESTSGLPTVDVAAAGDTRADWPAAVADGALLARQHSSALKEKLRQRHRRQRLLNPD